MIQSIDTTANNIQPPALIPQVIASDQLTYLPNLYYRKYKLIEKLNNLRYEFPQQKIMVPRNNTLWDEVIAEAKQKHLLINERKKYRIAEKYHIGKEIKDKVMKIQLKKEQMYMFHRVISSNLAQHVRNLFNQPTQTKNQQPISNHNTKPITNTIPAVENDEIFLENGGMQDRVDEDDDLFGELLNQAINHHDPRQNNDREKMMMDVQQPRGTIQTYFKKYFQLEEGYVPEQKKISKKSCLKKINDDIRKRMKNKAVDASTHSKSLGSATIILNNLINAEPDSKADQVIELPSIFDMALINQPNKNKKKKEEAFELRWTEEQIEELKKSNPNFDPKKCKIEPNLLTIHLLRTEEQYHKVFEKNIKLKKGFPMNLKSIPQLSYQPQQKFYNQFYDKEYEQFIMNNNKQKLMESFMKSSEFIFSDSYAQEQPKFNQPQSIGKLFINPNSYNAGRVIYKLHRNQLSAVIKPFNDKNNLSNDHLLLLSYLVRRYLSQFGNNWKLICQCVRMNPCFSHLMLNSQQVQQLFQFIELKTQSGKQNFGKVQLWEKKILPFLTYTSGSYEKYLDQKILTFMKDDTKMTEETIEDDEDQIKQLNLSNYEQLLKQPLTSTETYTSLKNMNDEYDQYLKIVKIEEISSPEFQSINHHKVFYKFGPQTEEVKVTVKNVEKSEFSYKILDSCKSDTKVNNCQPKNKKIVNEKTSELVRVLQSLRKGQPPIGPPIINPRQQPTPTPKIAQPTPPQPKLTKKSQEPKIQQSGQKNKSLDQKKIKKLKKNDNKEDQTK